MFAFSESDVQNCLLGGVGGANVDELAMNLPLDAGDFSSFMLVISPTTRRGIGLAMQICLIIYPNDVNMHLFHYFR